MLDRATDEQLLQTGRALRDSGIEAHVMSTDEPLSMTTRYYELVRMLKAHGAAIAASGRPKTWFALVDGSVFFPDLARLAARLGAYRAADTLYLGLPNERRDWHDGGGGGGGAVVLTRQSRASSSCRASTRPTRRRPCGPSAGTRSSASASGAAAASTCAPSRACTCRPRDGRARHGLDVGLAHQVADACGDACFMQHYLLRDGWVLVNGVSISQHPDGLERRRSRPRARGGAGAAASEDRPRQATAGSSSTMAASRPSGRSWH